MAAKLPRGEGPQNGRSAFGLPLDFAVLAYSLVILIAIAARLHPRVAL